LGGLSFDGELQDFDGEFQENEDHEEQIQDPEIGFQCNLNILTNSGIKEKRVDSISQTRT
jgi:hypothetical protein